MLILEVKENTIYRHKLESHTKYNKKVYYIIIE